MYDKTNMGLDSIVTISKHLRDTSGATMGFSELCDAIAIQGTKCIQISVCHSKHVARVRARVHVCVRESVCVCVRACVLLCVCVCVCACGHLRAFVRACVHAYVCAYLYVCSRANACIYPFV